MTSQRDKCSNVTLMELDKENCYFDTKSKLRLCVCVCFPPPLDGQLLVGRLLHVNDNFLVHAGSQLEALLVLVFGNSTLEKKQQRCQNNESNNQISLFLFDKSYFSCEIFATYFVVFFCVNKPQRVLIKSFLLLEAWDRNTNQHKFQRKEGGNS